MRVGGNAAAGSGEFKHLHDEKRGKDGPDEEAKGDGGLDSATGGAGAARVRNAEEDGEGDGAGEPKDDGYRKGAQGNHAVEEAGHEERRQAQIGQHEQRPDGVEQHEVQAVGRPAAPRRCEQAHAIGGQAELDDAEDNGDNVEDSDDAELHLGRFRVPRTWPDCVITNCSNFAVCDVQDRSLERSLFLE